MRHSLTMDLDTDILEEGARAAEQRTIKKALGKLAEAQTLLDSLWPHEEAQAIRHVLGKAQSRITWMRTYGAQAQRERI